MAVSDSEAVRWLPSDLTSAESRSGRIGPIILEAKQTGERSAGNPHAAFDEAGAGNVVRPRWCDTRRRKSEPTGNTNIDLNRRVSPRPYQPDRERKSSGSETTFPEDLIDPVGIEAGVIAMADDVWAWCEKTNCRGRTVTVKIKWASFQISSRSRSIETPIETRDKLHELALELIRTVFPPQKGIRLVGVTLSNFRLPNMGADAELPFREI